MLYTKYVNKMIKQFSGIITILVTVIMNSPVYSQDGTNGGQSTDKKDMSYFSQEEMQFILGDKDQPWNYGRISISPYYLIGVGNFSLVLPYTTGFIVAFDHGIHHAFKPIYRRKSPLLPGLRVELAFNIFGPLSVNSLSITGGVLWLFPINSGKAGDIAFSTTTGMNFMRGQIGTSYYSNDALYLTATLGYQLSFSKVFFSLEGRFSYINDVNYPWYGVGGSVGVGYKFPQVSGSDAKE
jgi:hypothetical protein